MLKYHRTKELDGQRKFDFSVPINHDDFIPTKIPFLESIKTPGSELEHREEKTLVGG